MTNAYHPGVPVQVNVFPADRGGFQMSIMYKGSPGWHVVFGRTVRECLRNEGLEESVYEALCRKSDRSADATKEEGEKTMDPEQFRAWLEAGLEMLDEKPAKKGKSKPVDEDEEDEDVEVDADDEDDEPKKKKKSKHVEEDDEEEDDEPKAKKKSGKVTQKDVLAALRKYAQVEGKPAAVKLLKKVAGVASLDDIDDVKEKHFQKLIDAASIDD